MFLIRDNDTGEVSYDKNDYIHYLMSKLTKDDLSQLDERKMQTVRFYYQQHRDEIDKFRNGNYSERRVSIERFCENTKVKEVINKKREQISHGEQCDDNDR